MQKSNETYHSTRDQYETNTRETTRSQQGCLSGADEKDNDFSMQMENDTSEETVETQGGPPSSYDDAMTTLEKLSLTNG